MKRMALVTVIIIITVLSYFYFENKDVIITIEAEVMDSNDPRSQGKEFISPGTKIFGRLHIPYLLWKSKLSGQNEKMKKYILPGGEASFLFNVGERITVVSNEFSESSIEIVNESGEKKEDFFLIRFKRGVVSGVDGEDVTLTVQLHDVDGDALDSEDFPLNFDISKWSGGNDFNLEIALKEKGNLAPDSKPKRRNRARPISIHSKVKNISLIKK